MCQWRHLELHSVLEDLWALLREEVSTFAAENALVEFRLSMDVAERVTDFRHLATTLSICI